MPWLINAAQADKFRKSQKSLIIFDASYHLPTEKRDAHQEFIEKHIPDAHFFDLNLFKDPLSDHPAKLIKDEKIISEILSKLGVRNDYKIIFYDNSGLHTACRAAWMLKYFGHSPNLLYVLDGGLAAWEKQMGKLAQGPTTISPKKYQASIKPQYVATLTDIKNNLTTLENQIVDLRHPVRFAGGPETRPHLRSGHIPDSISFPYTSFFDTNGSFYPLEKIKRLLTFMSIDLKKPIISTCGSSVTACILDFLLDILNHKQHRVYEGSWGEWGLETVLTGENSITERPVHTCVEHNDPPPIP